MTDQERHRAEQMKAAKEAQKREIEAAREAVKLDREAAELEAKAQQLRSRAGEAAYAHQVAREDRLMAERHAEAQVSVPAPFVRLPDGSLELDQSPADAGDIAAAKAADADGDFVRPVKPVTVGDDAVESAERTVTATERNRTRK